MQTWACPQALPRQSNRTPSHAHGPSTAMVSSVSVPLGNHQGLAQDNRRGQADPRQTEGQATIKPSSTIRNLDSGNAVLVRIAGFTLSASRGCRRILGSNSTTQTTANANAKAAIRNACTVNMIRMFHREKILAGIRARTMSSRPGWTSPGLRRSSGWPFSPTEGRLVTRCRKGPGTRRSPAGLHRRLHRSRTP